MTNDKKQTERLLTIIGSQSNRSFANKCEISETTVRNIKKGKMPGRATLEKIAKQHGTTVDYLLNKDAPLTTGAFKTLKHKTAPDSGKVTTPTYIPVVGRVPAGIPETNEWEIDYSIQVPDMPEHCFAMKVIGDSMEPRIMEGEHVIFTLDYTLESGNVVIVTDEYGDSMVKRYKIKDGVQYLVSDNSKYPPVKPNGGFNIVGKVISSVLLKKH